MKRPTYFKPSLERELVPALLNVARAMGHWAEVNGVHRGGTTTRSGFGVGSPDILVLLWPHWVALWVEAKRDDKQKLRPSQEKWHAEAKRVGLNVVTVASVDELVNAIIVTVRKFNNATRPAAPSPEERIFNGLDEIATRVRR